MSAVDPQRHAEMLANRLKKNHRRLHKRFARERIEAYRLYDRDIPEVRAVVDRYGDHLVVGVYGRAQTDHLEGYLETIGRAAVDALGLPHDALHLRRRQTRPDDGARYKRLGESGTRIAVREGPLSFWVNLDDYLDTGLFSDHRLTRRWVAARCANKSLLNLFGYTGAFTVWAAHGGAAETVTVDSSSRYLEWAKDNLRLNELEGRAHRMVQRDVGSFLSRERARYDLIVCDPPSFSTRFGEADFDVQRDQRQLLSALRPRVGDDGLILFSTNHQRFEPRLEGLGFTVEEITAETVPEDFRNRQVHRAFVLRPA